MDSLGMTATVDLAMQRAQDSRTQGRVDPRLAAVAQSGDPEEIRRVAEEFEAVFVGQMLDHMFSGLETEGAFFGGHGEKMFRGMMVEEYGKQIAQAGGIGIADSVMREILMMQEGQTR